MKTFKKFLNENHNWYDIDDKLNLLKSYVHILDNNRRNANLTLSDVELDDTPYEISKNYFIVIHNYLIIERMFIDDVVASGKEIYKNLDLERLTTTEEIYTKFFELYDIWHPVRNNIETFNNIESVRQYIKANRDKVYKTFMKP